MTFVEYECNTELKLIFIRITGFHAEMIQLLIYCELNQNNYVFLKFLKFLQRFWKKSSRGDKLWAWMRNGFIRRKPSMEIKFKKSKTLNKKDKSANVESSFLCKILDELEKWFLPKKWKRVKWETSSSRDSGVQNLKAVFN